MSKMKQVFIFVSVLTPRNAKLIKQMNLEQLERYKKNLSIIPNRDRLDVVFSAVTLCMIDLKIFDLRKE